MDESIDDVVTRVTRAAYTPGNVVHFTAMDLIRVLNELARLRAEHAAALATARREGAEAMRQRAACVIRAHRKVRTDREKALRADGVPQGDPAYLCLATAVVSLDRACAEVEALPLGGNGGAT